MMRNSLSAALAIISLAFPSAADPPPLEPVDETIEALLAQQDTNHDSLITTADQGSRLFFLNSHGKKPFLVEGTYRLGNLLQQLGAARREGKRQIQVTSAEIFLNPAQHVSFMIREYYWNWLTRTVDAKGLSRIVDDPKLAGAPARVYVPFGDAEAWKYYSTIASENPSLHVEAIRLPETVTPEFARSLNSAPGILALALVGDDSGALSGEPFVVPGGRFNEMYGWDSYFIALGLLADGRTDLARSMVDNFVYQIEHYGKILNANRTYYLTRSQPPFLTSMALAVYEKLPRTGESRSWLERAVRAAIREYETVWTAEPHLTPTGLSRYFGSGLGVPPEVEPGHFAPIIRPLAAAKGLTEAEFEKRYIAGMLSSPELDESLKHDRAMRESGHDTCYRLIGRAADLNTVALNALLYKYESDLASIIEQEFGGSITLASGDFSPDQLWKKRAQTRRELMMKLMWDEQRALFFDYDFVHAKRLDDVSATTFYPLWAGMMNREEGQRLARAALALLEEPGGIVAGTEESRGRLGAGRPPRQWDYPFGWAPHQMIAWRALVRCGLEEDARRIAYRWIYMIAMNAARSNGAIVEKYDVVARSIEASAEYGNVGSRFKLVPDGGFGWTNASYQVAWSYVSDADRESLGRLIPPEWVFGASRESQSPE
ncbi:MAG: hypothetical protein KF691_15510 [Phycisphaeraceae bacterium]|nr:hypothetical protein [Phycisphaeraceae bacterium]